MKAGNRIIWSHKVTKIRPRSKYVFQNMDLSITQNYQSGVSVRSGSNDVVSTSAFFQPYHMYTLFFFIDKSLHEFFPSPKICAREFRLTVRLVEKDYRSLQAGAEQCGKGTLFLKYLSREAPHRRWNTAFVHYCQKSRHISRRIPTRMIKKLFGHHRSSGLSKPIGGFRLNWRKGIWRK